MSRLIETLDYLVRDPGVTGLLIGVIIILLKRKS